MTVITMATEAMSTQIEFGSRTFWALLPVFLLTFVIVAYALGDLRRAKHVRYLPKLVWALLIVLGSAPLGALAYLVVGRTRHEADSDDHGYGASGGEDPADDGPERVGPTGRHLSRYERGIRL